MELFTCRPRPADESLNEGLPGGIPKPLLGELVGHITATLADGGLEVEVRAVRFEPADPCGSGA